MQETNAEIDRPDYNLVDNIKRLVQLGGGGTAVSKRTEIPLSTLNSWLAGKTEPKFSAFMKLLEASQPPYREGENTQASDLTQTAIESVENAPNLLLVGLGVDENDIFRPLRRFIATNTKHIPIPRFSVEASAGAGALANDDANDGYLSVTRDWLSQFVSPGSRVSAIQARGESMEPTIRDGDLLLVNHDIQDADVAAGGIFVITHGGGVKVKRLEATANGMIRLSSDAGERYGQELIPAAELKDTLIVHGQVFWSGGRLRA